MRLWIWASILTAGCAQIQAQQGPSWLRAQQGWTSDRIVCLGHSGADGGVRAADHAAARCTAGYATAWLNPAIAQSIDDAAQAQRTIAALGRLAKVTARYTDPATGEVVSKMELTADEVDRQLQRELMDNQELLDALRPEIAKGASGVKASPLDPPWLKEGWAKLEPQAELSEAVRKDLEAQEAARAAEQAADEKDESKAEVGAEGQTDQTPEGGAVTGPEAPMTAEPKPKAPGSDAERGEKEPVQPDSKDKKKSSDGQDAAKPAPAPKDPAPGEQPAPEKKD